MDEISSVCPPPPSWLEGRRSLRRQDQGCVLSERFKMGFVTTITERILEGIICKLARVNGYTVTSAGREEDKGPWYGCHNHSRIGLITNQRVKSKSIMLFSYSSLYCFDTFQYRIPNLSRYGHTSRFSLSNA